MQTEHKKKLQELQQIISKMPLGVICMTVLPEFGVQWREVFRAVRNSRLPMVPASMARVLSKHAAKSLPLEEIAEIVSRLRLKLVATQERKWFVIDLQEPIHEEASIAHMTQTLPCRVANALKKGRGRINMQPENMEAAERPKLEDEIRTKQEEVFRIQEEVSAEDAETRRLQDGGEKARRKQIQAVLLGELLYMSVQLVSANKEGAVLYVATPPPYPVALVSSLNSSLLKACVEGLGYKKHEDAQLFGRDVLSLLRIHDTRHDENVRHLASLPEYNPVPVVTPSGIDFTNKTYDEKYIEEILGPNPPLLTDLEITSEKPFFDPSRLNKKISLKVQIKSEDIAKSLKTWVTKGALSPTSDYFQIFHKVKSNKITFQDDMED